jgi:arginine exporter protein ArgO
MGSALWWFLLSAGVGLFREKFNARGLQWVNWISGAIILGFGLYAIFSVI